MGKKRILVIDDEASFTKLVKMNLEATGKYEVGSENDGKRALDTAIRYKPDLILLDIKMPEIDGGEVAHQLRSNSATRAIPVVFVTALVSDNDVKMRDGVIGGYNYIAKPVETQQLVEVIESVLAQS